MNLEEKIINYINMDLVRDKAEARVLTEILLYRISKSTVSRKVTVKGGVVIMNL